MANSLFKLVSTSLFVGHLMAVPLASHAQAQAQAGAMPCAGAASAPCDGPRMPGRDATGMGRSTMMMMTPAERATHHERMQSFHSYEECKAYIDDLHQRMAARARERGVAMPAAPVRDPCSTLPKVKP